jgi:hypothetical protein
MMRGLITAVIFSLVILGSAHALSVSECYSDDGDSWKCSDNEFCVCEISGSCSHGDLLIYENDIDDVLCIPKIIDSQAEFSPLECMYDSGDTLKVRAVCDEGYSPEKDLDIYLGTGTTISGTTLPSTTNPGCQYSCQITCNDDREPPYCFEAISHGTQGCSGGDICCELIPVQCTGTTLSPTTVSEHPCPYECCVDTTQYEHKFCDEGLKCCSDNKCRENCSPKAILPTSGLIVLILAALIPIGALMFYFLNSKAKSAEF